MRPGPVSEARRRKGKGGGGIRVAEQYSTPSP